MRTAVVLGLDKLQWVNLIGVWSIRLQALLPLLCEGLCRNASSRYLSLQMTLLLRMDDKMNRQLTCELSIQDTPSVLATELVHYGFINKVGHRRRWDVKFVGCVPARIPHHLGIVGNR
ncbi:hypothetical protein HPB48_006967 [Haemaphysalis longicornis]|uniref:Uncharacterized protein n=1 Tax=Haemaphysalis longicornis TaxID=44386 RepID=A0A9J6FP04_HAELO|nr:hypothetical protein HPB48_006967 [Haemaphysalis longicornis]